ncbi:MAG: hypothetical protein C5B50_26365 [Verrucomicrobia bacterium]|nr:MAG: hypothetical protein C5B50_26365 [Verrucomicrobiota bacterium]
MKTIDCTIIVAQAALVLCAMGISFWKGVAWPGLLGLGLLGLAPGVGGLGAEAGQSRSWLRIRQVAACAGLLLAITNLLAASAESCPDWLASLLCPVGAGNLIQTRHSGQGLTMEWLAAVTLIMVVVMLPGTFVRADVSWQRFGKVQFVTWLFFVCGDWLAAAYFHDRPLAFHAGLIVLIGLLIWCKRLFRIPAPMVLAVNTIILFLVCLPVTNLFIRPFPHVATRIEPGKATYVYQAAKKDPAAYRSWWYYISSEWVALRKRIGPFAGREDGIALVPNSSGRFAQSHVHINSHGFRGKEILQPKADIYRIFAIGESTTFGMTLNPEDRPWPEVLEEMIRTRLKLKRPVEVINAGVPALTIRTQLGSAGPVHPAIGAGHDSVLPRLQRVRSAGCKSAACGFCLTPALRGAPDPPAGEPGTNPEDPPLQPLTGARSAPAASGHD